MSSKYQCPICGDAMGRTKSDYLICNNANCCLSDTFLDEDLDNSWYLKRISALEKESSDIDGKEVNQNEEKGQG